jgi:curved DNA-binding protein CbpA
MSDDTYYSVLGVSETATQAQIKAAYRNLLKQIHPDTVATLSPDLRHIAEGATKEITAAYSLLSDATKRGQYDRGLAELRLKSVRPPTTPAVPRGPQVHPQTSPAASDSHGRRRIHHGHNRHPVKAWAIAILAAFVILAGLVFLGSIVMGIVDPASDSDDSKVFARLPNPRSLAKHLD